MTKSFSLWKGWAVHIEKLATWAQENTGGWYCHATSGSCELRLGLYNWMQSSFHKYWMLEDKGKGEKPRPVGRKQAINPVIVYIHMQSVWEMSSKWHYRKEIMTWLVIQKCNEINQRAEMLILMDAICAEGQREKMRKGCTVHQKLVCKLRSVGG